MCPVWLYLDDEVNNLRFQITFPISDHCKDISKHKSLLAGWTEGSNGSCRGEVDCHYLAYIKTSALQIQFWWCVIHLCCCMFLGLPLSVVQVVTILYVAFECLSTFSLTFFFLGVSWLSSLVVVLFLLVKVLLLNISGAYLCPTTWVQRHSSILCSFHSPLGSDKRKSYFVNTAS